MFSGLVRSSSTVPEMASFPINMGRYSDFGERLLKWSESQGRSCALPFPFVRQYWCWLRPDDDGECRLAGEDKETWERVTAVSTLEKKGSANGSSVLKRCFTRL